MRIILVDDEKGAIDELQYFLSQYPGVEVAGAFSNPVKALEETRSIAFDAAFLDIDMPVINGLNVASELLKRNDQTAIVFVTAFNDYAVRAFEINAIDYILKPVMKDRLDRTIDKLTRTTGRDRVLKKSIIEKINRIDKHIKQDQERIVAYHHEDGEITLLKISDILYFEALQGATFIASGQGRFKSRDTLDMLQIKYSRYGFFRCHRGYLVNMRYINKITPFVNNSYSVGLEGSALTVPVSRKNFKELKRLLGIE